ncbi:MAG: hypothetical protein M5R38_07005 [Candidatus Methylomirabilis sp.]|nr:hypothetical protein [Candidatus Methylomirabilis sp.]
MIVRVLRGFGLLAVVVALTACALQGGMENETSLKTPPTGV